MTIEQIIYKTILDRDNYNERKNGWHIDDSISNYHTARLSYYYRNEICGIEIKIGGDSERVRQHKMMMNAMMSNDKFA